MALSTNSLTNGSSSVNSYIDTLKKIDPKASDSEPKGVGKASLDQRDFMTLMTAQLKTQDPFQAMDQAQMMNQITQFGMVDSQQKMVTQFNKVASLLSSNEVLQSVPLLDRDVLVSSDKGYLDQGGAVQGLVKLTAGASEVRLSITDANGVLVRQESFGPQSEGEIPFSWSGEDSRGELMPPGLYTVQVLATRGEKSEAVETLMASRVTGVLPASGADTLKLQLRGMDPIELSEVKKVM